MSDITYSQLTLDGEPVTHVAAFDVTLGFIDIKTNDAAIWNRYRERAAKRGDIFDVASWEFQRPFRVYGDVKVEHATEHGQFRASPIYVAQEIDLIRRLLNSLVDHGTLLQSHSAQIVHHLKRIEQRFNEVVIERNDAQNACTRVEARNKELCAVIEKKLPDIEKRLDEHDETKATTISPSNLLLTKIRIALVDMYEHGVEQGKKRSREDDVAHSVAKSRSQRIIDEMST